MKISFKIDRTIRLKVTNKCNLACHYCHHEGQSKDDFIWNSRVEKELIDLFNILQIKRIHITGGEPTLYPHLNLIVKTLSQDYEIGLTTNGQCPPNILLQLVKDGLHDITFSILTFNPIEFQKTQLTNHDNFDPNKLKSNIIMLKKHLPIDINIPFSPFILNKWRFDIVKFAVNNNIDINLLDIVGDSIRTQKLIKEFIQSLDILPKEEIKYVNSSKGKKVFNFKNGTALNIKLLNKFYLMSLCNDCKLKNECDEKYYGLRMFFMENQINICPCLKKNLSFPIHEFYYTEIFNEIINKLRSVTC